MKNVLSISASVQGTESLSRALAAEVVERLNTRAPLSNVVERDLSDNRIELLTASHVGAFYTPKAERNQAQNSILALSDELLAELKAADVLVISTPMYNFSIPASLKAWIDLICRVGESFRYTDKGPEGLLNIDTLYLVVATGGAPIGSAVDFVVPYMKQIASFIGIKHVEVIAADGVNAQKDLAIDTARAKIAAI